MQFMQLIMNRYKGLGKYRQHSICLMSAVFLCLFSMTGCVTLAGNGKLKKNAVVAPTPTMQTKTVKVAKVPSAVDTLRNLAPNKGLKTARLFAEPLKNTDMRVARLETSVQKLKDDFDTVTPAVVRLVEIEKDIKGLIEQLETLVDGEDAQPSQPPSQEPIQTPVTQNTMAPVGGLSGVPASATKLSVVASKLTIEENANATRLVLNVSDKVAFDTKIASDGKSLDIIILNSSWTGDRNWSSDFSPLVASYNVVKDGDNHIIHVKFNFPSRIIKKDTLPAKAGQGYKLIIDIQSDTIHFP